MAHRKKQSGRCGVAGDGGDRWHREREEIGDYILEECHHMAEEIDGFGRRSSRSGSGPEEIETIREKLTLGEGDKNGAGS